MKNLLERLMRLIDVPRHMRLFRRRWLNPQGLLVFGISALFLTSMAWTLPPFAHDEVPASVQAALQAAETPGEAPTADPNARPTRTPLPPEYITNSSQTIGITLAAAVLVLIVVIGVLLFGVGRED